MSTVNTHYPSFNVLDQIEMWDSHTKEIVRQRLGPFNNTDFLTEQESRDIALIARHIVYDDRMEIITWVVRHIDQKLKSDIGESQRGTATPPEKVLIREGLEALNHAARLSFGSNFADIDAKRQYELIVGLQMGHVPTIPEWSYISPQDLFKKLVAEIVSAYYSHPTVWSEIGYGGPVYPNVYVRVELGLTDPWEAKRHGE